MISTRVLANPHLTSDGCARWRFSLPGFRLVCRLAPCLMAAAVPASVAWAQVDEPAAVRSEAPQLEQAFVVAAAIEHALVEAIASAEKSVVSIARVKRGDPLTPDFRSESPFGPGFSTDSLPNTDPRHPDFVPNEFGTGVVIDAEGLVLTNLHICGDLTDGQRSKFFIITVDRKVFDAEIIGANRRADLAVLRVTTPVSDGDFVPITFGDASKLRKGQIVVSLGNPYSIARDGQVSASWGIVSNLSRKAPPSPDSRNQRALATLHEFGTLIHTDAKLNLGTSGGALINLRGEMVGLTTSLAALAGYEQPAGYAIPIDEAFLSIIEVLKRGKEVAYGMLGVKIENLPAEELDAGIHGVRVHLSQDGMPASRAGILKDDIITHVGGVPIHDTDKLMLELGKRFASTETSITVLRRNDGRTHDLKVRLTKFPSRADDIVTAPDAGWRGLKVEYPSAVPEPEFNPRPLYRVVVPTVVVIDAEQDSPAWEAELRRGVHISHVAGNPIEDPQDFYRQVSRLPGEVRLTILDRGRSRVVTVAAP